MKLPNLAKYLLHAVEVKWIDSATDVGWKAEINCDPVRITSVGILVRFNEKAITISHSISEYGRVCDSITIPRGCIQNIKRLSDQKAVDFEVKIT